MAWKFAKPEDEDEGDGWVAVGVTAGAWGGGMKDGMAGDGRMGRTGAGAGGASDGVAV